MAICVALVVGAGQGTRIGGDLPKQYLSVAGETVIRRTLRAFAGHARVDAVRTVINPEHRPHFDAAAAGLGVLDPVAGGATRQDSVRLGLESLLPLSPELVLIHDAARPFVDARIIDRVIDALAHGPGAIPVLPITDTLKRTDERQLVVSATVERAGLVRAQTPQGFHYSAILHAHRLAAGAAAMTDDAQVAENAGLAITVVAGSEENVKLTTPEDMVRADRLFSAGETRMGFGFDVHRFGQGDRIWLCGIEIPFDAGLEGHSDADVGLHALTDAILGAISQGDIGDHFPPSDPKWRGAPSDIFLRHAAALTAAAGGRIVNLDVTIVCERPRIGPLRRAMIERVAAIAEVPAARVSVKATTTERLGFTGRGEGIAAQAVATVFLPQRPL